jgi:DNA-binding XRE family transcriptional regulator
MHPAPVPSPRESPLPKLGNFELDNNSAENQQPTEEIAKQVDISQETVNNGEMNSKKSSLHSFNHIFSIFRIANFSLTHNPTPTAECFQSHAKRGRLKQHIPKRQHQLLFNHIPNIRGTFVARHQQSWIDFD